MRGKIKNPKKLQTSYNVLAYNAKRIEKDKKRISASVRERIKNKLDKLNFPFPVNLDIRHLRENFYRIRVGNYRVLIGVVPSKKTIWIYSIRKRDKTIYTLFETLMIV